MTDAPKFSFSVQAGSFDDHIDDSIRGYKDLCDDVVSISRYFVEDNTNVLDIGCSTGKLINRIAERNEQAPNSNFVGLDVEKNFQEYWKNESNVTCQLDDIRQYDKLENLSLVTSLFTLQFIAEQDRTKIIKRIYEGLIEGGAFIFSEKVYSLNPKIQNMLDMIYYDYKKKSFSEKEILDKEQELRHLMKLTTEHKLIRSCESVGFKGIQVFWRNFNFIGVLAIKRPVADMEE